MSKFVDENNTGNELRCLGPIGPRPGMHGLITVCQLQMTSELTVRVFTGNTSVQLDTLFSVLIFGNPSGACFYGRV